MRIAIIILGSLVGLVARAEQAVPSATTPAVALESAPLSSGERFVLACATELAKLGRPSGSKDCEQLVARSHLIQSDAIRYLTAATDKQRQAFANASTLGRYEILEAEADPGKLILLLLAEHEAPNSHMAVQLAKDVMKPSCGYYQIEALLRTLGTVNGLPQVQVARAGKGKAVQSVYESCVGKSQDGAAQNCLNPIFQTVATSELSPNP